MATEGGVSDEFCQLCAASSAVCTPLPNTAAYSTSLLEHSKVHYYFMDARMIGMWTTECGGHDGQRNPQHNLTFFAVARRISHGQSGPLEWTP